MCPRRTELEGDCVQEDIEAAISGFKSIILTGSVCDYDPNLIRAALRLRYQTVERLQALAHFAQRYNCAPVVTL